MRKKSKYNVAVVGVGAVGVEMLRVLRSRDFPVRDLKVLARSGRVIGVDGHSYHVEEITPAAFDGVDIALFAGTEGEKGAAVTYAAEAVRRGALVIDNGADFRLEADVPLVVPEVNPRDAGKALKGRGIIANPNCSTIQMVVALAPIHKLLRIKKVVVATYQAASGAGSKAAQELVEQTRGVLEGRQVVPQALGQRIAFNLFPQIGGFSEAGYTSEEWKMVHETRKILHDPKLNVSATTVRVPVRTGHGEAVYIECRRPVDIAAVRQALSRAPGIVVVDDPAAARYPMPADVEGKDDVFVGRIRKDPSDEKALWLWVVADNLRKGAATNAVQIAELFIKKGGK
ncbi:MAG: aspartate-semialdehyde dehydrogenase [Deltaproteobacteria bacterium]